MTTIKSIARQHKAHILAAAVLGVAVLLGASGALVQSFAKAQDASATIGQGAVSSHGQEVSAESSGIRISLIEASFSSTKTELLFRLEPVGREASPGLHLFGPISETGISVTGLRDGILEKNSVLLGQAAVRGEKGEDLRLLVLNGIEAAGAPFSIAISEVCLSKVSGNCDGITGDWHFNLVASIPEEDLRLERVRLDSSITWSGVSIQVEEIASSMSEVLVSYRIDGPETGLVLLGSGLSAMALPDGSHVRVVTDKLIGDGSRIASFPPLAEGIATFNLMASGVLVKPNAGLGILEFSLPDVDPNGGEISALDINASDTIEGQRFHIENAEAGQGLLRITVTPADSDTRVVLGGPTGTISLVDENWSSFPLLEQHGEFPERNSVTEVGKTVFVFDVSAASRLTDLRLVADVYHLVKGPWQWQVSLR